MNISIVNNHTDLYKVYEACEEMKQSYPLWDEEYPLYENYLDSFNDGLVLAVFSNEKVIASLTIDYDLSFTEGCDNSDFPNNNIFEDAASLSKFMVLPEYQKHGLGLSLFTFAEDYIKNNTKYKSIAFLVYCTNVHAIHLYSKWDYSNLGKYNVEWSSNSNNDFYYLFYKKLI